MHIHTHCTCADHFDPTKIHSFFIFSCCLFAQSATLNVNSLKCEYCLFISLPLFCQLYCFKFFSFFPGHFHPSIQACDWDELMDVDSVKQSGFFFTFLLLLWASALFIWWLCLWKAVSSVIETRFPSFCVCLEHWCLTKNSLTRLLLSRIPLFLREDITDPPVLFLPDNRVDHK